MPTTDDIRREATSKVDNTNLQQSLRSTKFHPYRVEMGGLTAAQISTFCGDVGVGLRKLQLQSPFRLYEEIIDFLQNLPHSEIVALKDLHAARRPSRITIALRHDIDADIITALRCAEHLSGLGIPGSFYVLHTSGYYGRMREDGVFERYEGMAHLAQNFAATSVETGVHCDALHLYQTYHTDGVDGLRTEIEWLREQGLAIEGVVAHNSAPVYGAENFEIFKGLSRNKRSHVSQNGVTVPLGHVELSDWGLTYEGNFSRAPYKSKTHSLETYLSKTGRGDIRSKVWQEAYFLRNPVFARQYEVSVWLLARDKWVMAIHNWRRREVFWPVSTEDLRLHLSALRRSTRIVLNIHPEYVAG